MYRYLSLEMIDIISRKSHNRANMTIIHLVSEYHRVRGVKVFRFKRKFTLSTFFISCALKISRWVSDQTKSTTKAEPIQ